MSTKNNRQAFSLLELSLVVIIISLLMAGASSGLKIVRKAQIQSTIKDILDYKYAFHEFVILYQALPGDFDQAYEYFAGEDDTICGEDTDCNGDGDGKIEVSQKANSEEFRAWQHLYLTGLVDTAFAGEWNEDNSVAEAKVNNANISFKFDDELDDNILKLGSFISINGEYSDGGILTTKEAKNIDQKFDDGISNSGKIIGYNDGNIDDTDNTETDICINDDYRTFSNSENLCSIGFKLGS
ncbi:prepilin-type N-terminal cleavage/methylation domain-containing protein [Rickettsiales bacterium]|nr:prepilin-type N-terminal cleavage/methylation domain-containing protein [Rickettsiales bacterium]